MAVNVFLFACVFVVSGSLAALPGGMKSCKQSSGDYKQCLVGEIQKAITFFAAGNEKLGVNSLEPFKFSKMEVNQGTGPVAIKLELTNTDIHGFSKAKIVDATNDWKTITIEATADVIEIIGDYTVSGKVLVLPIAGTGKSNITMYDVKAILTIKLKEIDNKGKPYVQAESIAATVEPKRTNFDLQNLFNGDKALGDNMNKFLNENHDQIVKELNPAISTGLSLGFGEFVNQIFSKIPLKEVKA